MAWVRATGAPTVDKSVAAADVVVCATTSETETRVRAPSGRQQLPSWRRSPDVMRLNIPRPAVSVLLPTPVFELSGHKEPRPHLPALPDRLSRFGLCFPLAAFLPLIVELLGLGQGQLALDFSA